MTDVFDTIESASKTIRERLSVNTVYGEPVTHNGSTVIPVSKVSYGFGGGGGSGAGMEPGLGSEDAKSGTGSGGGMGGGGMVEPLGYIEITDAGTRYVPIEPPRGEVFLRVLALAPAFLPTGKGRGSGLRRLLLILAGQAIIGGAMRRQLGGGFGRLQIPGRHAEEPA